MGYQVFGTDGVHLADRVTIAGRVGSGMPLPVLPVAAGTENKIVFDGGSLSMTPGVYGDFHAYARTTVDFAPGDYYFRSFALEPDARLIFGRTGGAVRIWVQGDLRFADRTRIENRGTAESLLFYSNTAGTVRVGVESGLRAIVVVPSGTIDVPSRTRFSGSLWAKTVTIQPDTEGL
jgi:hypothetical protein